MDEQCQERLTEAMDLADEGKPKAALKIFDSLITDFPTEMQPRFERAMVYLDTDNEKAAISDLEHILQFEPDYSGARDWFARVSAGQGKHLLAAETSLTDLLSKAPEHWSANGQSWADCARHFLDAGDPSRALAVLDVYFERYEGRQQGYEMYIPAPYRMRARALLATNRPAEALAAAEVACAHTHSVPADKFVRIEALLMLGRQSEARDAFALMADFRGTDGFVEIVAYAQSLNVTLE